MIFLILISLLILPFASYALGLLLEKTANKAKQLLKSATAQLISQMQKKHPASQLYSYTPQHHLHKKAG